MSALTRARRAFYTAGGPYLRARAAEAVGSERWSWPALHELDRKLDALLGGRTGGVFVEAGAHDGYTQSNTYALERRRGWRGVLVEPVPELHAKAARRRAASTVVHAALVAPEAAGRPVPIAFGDLMSQVAATETEHTAAGLVTAGRDPYVVQVPGRTLDDVLDEAGVGAVDLLLLDLEGHELDALRGLDTERHPVAHLVVEVLDCEAQLPAFRELLAGRFELQGMLTHCDAHFAAASTPTR